MESSVFWGNTAITLITPETLQRPNSPYVLPMSRVMLGCGILRLSEFQCFSVELGEQWDWSDDPLNFSESGWWGRIFSAMKVLIPILIGHLKVLNN